MSRHRSLPGADEEFLEAVRGTEDADRCDANRGSTPVVGLGNPGRIGSLVKLPEGFDARVYTLEAAEDTIRGLPQGGLVEAPATCGSGRRWRCSTRCLPVDRSGSSSNPMADKVDRTCRAPAGPITCSCSSRMILLTVGK